MDKREWIATLLVMLIIFSFFAVGLGSGFNLNLEALR